MGGFKPTGVNPRLVEKVRGALDGAGYPDVRIVASGGFTAERIREFEAAGVPVDAYGVGSSLIRGDNDFTADVVLRRRAAVREGGTGAIRRIPAWRGLSDPGTRADERYCPMIQAASIIDGAPSAHRPAHPPSST